MLAIGCSAGWTYYSAESILTTMCSFSEEREHQQKKRDELDSIRHVCCSHATTKLVVYLNPQFCRTRGALLRSQQMNITLTMNKFMHFWLPDTVKLEIDSAYSEREETN